MAKPRKKKRAVGKRQIETALPKKQYKRTNRLLYVFSGILLVVFGGGAALLGTGNPGGASAPAPTAVPAIVDNTQAATSVPSPQFTATPAPTQGTPTPAQATPVPTP